MKVDKFTFIILVCPKIIEIVSVNPEEVIDTDYAWPETLKALCIVGKKVNMDEDNFDSIEHVNLGERHVFRRWLDCIISSS